MDPVRVLVVEDNRVDAKLLRMAFQIEEEEGVDLVVAETGPKALALLRSQPLPDLVVLDWNLPGGNGLEVLRAIRADAGLKDLPVVMFSSSPSELTEQQARKADVSADGYFTKPFDYDDFVHMARLILHRYERRPVAGSMSRLAAS